MILFIFKYIQIIFKVLCKPSASNKMVYLLQIIDSKRKNYLHDGNTGQPLNWVIKMNVSTEGHMNTVCSWGLSDEEDTNHVYRIPAKEAHEEINEYNIKWLPVRLRNVNVMKTRLRSYSRWKEMKNAWQRKAWTLWERKKNMCKSNHGDNSPN